MFIEFCKGFAEFVGAPLAIFLGLAWIGAGVFLIWETVDEIRYMRNH